MGTDRKGKDGQMSRRAFVGASAVAVATLAAIGCSPENSLSETDNRKIYRLDPEVDEGIPGEWIPVECWAHCGGKCALKAYVADGVCLRLKTDDTHEDSPDNPQRRACPRGRSRRLEVFGSQRMKYPMKRKSWQPGGGENAHGELRGFDEWERISWDDALDTIATEMQRIKDTYGNRAFLGAGWHPAADINWGVPNEFSDSLRNR